MFKKWSLEELQLCTQYFKDGLTNADISSKLGRVEADISQQRRKFIDMQQQGGFWKKSDDDKLTEMWAQGVAPEDIGEAVGRSRGSVLNRAHRLGLPRRAPTGRKKGIPNRVNRTISKPKKAESWLMSVRAVPVPTIERSCLNCRAPFQTTSKFLRLCYDCRIVATRSSGDFYCFSPPEVA